MTEPIKIENHHDFEEWLETQAPEIAVALAARIAMRIMMTAVPHFDASDRDQRAALILPIFRAIAAPWVAAKYPTQGADLRIAANKNAFKAAANAANAANANFNANGTATEAAKAAPAFVATNAAAAAAFAADANAFADISATATATDAATKAAYAAAPFVASIWSEIAKDTEMVLQTSTESALPTLCDQKLWWQPHGIMSTGWRDFAEALSDRKRIKDPHTGATRAVPKDPEDRRNDENWWVWTDWMHARIIGAPAIEALEVERVLIPDEEWEKGPRHVNGLIAEMITRHQGDDLRAKAPLTETVARDPDTGLHTLLPDTVVDARRYENALNKVADTVERIRAARQTPGNDMYGELEIIFDGLDIAYATYRAEPMRMHDEFIKAQKRLLRKCESGAVLQDDELIEDLIDDLNNGHIDIRTSDEGVKAAVLSRATAKKRGLSGVEEHDLNLATEAKALVSDASLARQLREDRDVVKALDENGDHPEDPTPEDAAYRLASRLPRIDEKAVDKVVGAAEKMAKLNKGGEAGISWLRFFLDWLARRLGTGALRSVQSA